MSEPSQIEVNKVVRILQQAKPLKFTVQLHMKDGTITEFQADALPKLDWNQEAREMWVNYMSKSYDSTPCCALSRVDFITHDQNPE
jgi:hypothetical protein